MKSKLVSMLVLCALSVAIAVGGTGLVYKVFSQYLFYEIYQVSETVIDEPGDSRIEPGALYDEYFIPRSDYLKSISININQTASAQLNDEPQSYCIKGILKDDAGRIVRDAQYTVHADDVRERIYCQFSFETWVESGRQYQLSLVFPSNQTLSVTFGGETGHPAEHVALMSEGREIKDAMYLQYIYGTYSRKLLLLWFLAFFVAGYLIVQGGWMMHRKRNSDKTKVCDECADIKSTG